MSVVDRHRWPTGGPMNRVSGAYSKWRYVLEAVTPEGQLAWCGAFPAKQAA